MASESEGSSDSRLTYEAILTRRLARLPQHAQRAADSERIKAFVHRRLFDKGSRLLRVGRFELVCTLGRGGMGVVYEAFDPLRGDRVALKMLHGRGPAQLYQLKHEFRSLAGLSHPNLIGLHDLYVDDDGAYFSMDLIEGRDFSVYARGVDQVSFERALRQLCAGLHALHAAGKLHRDLKPQNVLVTDAGRVVLLDFGLADAPAAARGSAAGTPACMAPEQARGQPCESSDWYGFGALLGLALRARRTSGHPTPPMLERLAEQLTDPSPTRRPGWREVEALLGGAPAAGSIATGRCFVGRSAELQRLSEALRRSTREPLLLSVRGESGIGKSALLHHFLHTRARAAGALVLSGRCYERESVPYKALDGVMDELSRYLLSLPQAYSAQLCPQDTRALLQVFPVLARVPALRRAGHGEPGERTLELRPQAVSALKHVLRRLSVEQPLVICIDDLQWSDTDSGRLLGELLGDDDAPALLVLCSDRNDPHADNPVLAELRRLSELAPSALHTIQLELGPLPAAEVTALATQALGEHDARPETSARVAAESRGSPLLAVELAHFAGARRAHPEARDLPLSVESLFEQRLQGLDSDATRVLQLVAAAGRPVTAAVVARAARLGQKTSLASAQLRRARLLRAVLHDGAEVLVLHHDRVAQVALGSLSARQRRGLHARLARTFQALEGPTSDALFEQYLAADRPHHAARCARRAGASALRALAFARAARLLSQALELGVLPPSERTALERDLALALEHAGRPLEAAAAYRRAAATCDQPLAAVQLQQRAAQHLLRNAEREQGVRLLQHCYAQLGLTWPRGRVHLLLSIAWLLLALRLRIRRARGRHDLPLLHARAELTGAVGTTLEQHDALRAVHNTLLCMHAMARLPEPSWQLRVEGTAGLLRSAGLSPGGAARGLRQVQQACDAAARLNDAQALSDLQRQLAFALLLGGRPGATLAAARACEAQLRAQALPPLDRYEVVAIVGIALYELGELGELRRSWRQFTHEARMHGDPLIALWIHVHPANFALLLAAGEREPARLLLEQQARLLRQCPTQRGIAWAHAVCAVEEALYWDEPRRAQRLLRSQRDALFGSGYPFLTRAARQLRARSALAAANTLEGRQRVRQLRTATCNAVLLRWGARGLQQGTSELLAAGLAAARRQPERALRALEAALPVLERERAKLLIACAWHFQGELLGGEQGRTLQLAAANEMRARGICDPERWARWTVPGFP